MRVRARVEVTRASAELATMREQLKAVTVERDHYAERIATLVDADRALEKVRAEVERLRVRMRDAEVAARGAQVTIEAWVPEGQSVDNNDNYCYLMDWLKGCPPDGQQELTRAAEARGLEAAKAISVDAMVAIAADKRHTKEDRFGAHMHDTETRRLLDLAASKLKEART